MQEGTTREPTISAELENVASPFAWLQDDLPTQETCARSPIEMDAEEIDIPATLQKPEELADDEGL